MHSFLSLLDIFKGYNGTLLAYGQTGSGKTYTMMVLLIYSLNLHVHNIASQRVTQMIPSKQE